MERMKQLFRRFLVWIGAAFMLLGFSACGRTDAGTYAMPTDVERLFTTAAELESLATTTPDYDLPNGNFEWAYKSENGNLVVSVNAPIRVPATPLTIRHVSAEGFTQSQVTGIFHRLFAGQTVTTKIGENVQTKVEIQAQLEQMQQALSDGTYTEYGFTKGEYEEAIRQQEAALESAPNATKGGRVATDGTLLTVRDTEYGDYQVLSAQTDANDSLVVRSAPSHDRSALQSSVAYDRYNAPDYSMLDAVAILPGDTLPKLAQGKLECAFDEAKRLSDDLIVSADVDVSLLAAYVVDDRQVGSTDGVFQDAAHFAYVFQYTRTIGGIPVATDCWTDDDGSSAFPWDQERISVTVDDAGIAQFRWDEPLTLQADTTDCASILTFPQAQEIFEKMIPLIYEAQTTSANPKLDRVKIDIGLTAAQLCLFRMKDPTAESKSGILVPAWVFYGNIVSQTFWKDGTASDPTHRQGMNGSAGCDFSPGPTIVLAVNAIDGSVIDASMGY